MAAAATLSDGSLPAILKHKARRWRKLPVKGDSVGINDPTLKQGYLGDLQAKTMLQLEELIVRQDKILNDSNFIRKLKDGGQRLRNRRLELQAALDRLVRSSEDTVCVVPDVNALEWQWRSASKHVSSRYQGTSRREESSQLDDSDDDKTDEVLDPLELMATHSRDAPSVPAATARQCRDSKSLQDPADVIREELHRLDISDAAQQLPASSNDVKTEATTNNLCTDFCSKLLLNYEKKIDKNVSKNVFKPFRFHDQQELLFKANFRASPFTGDLNIKDTSNSNNSCASLNATLSNAPNNNMRSKVSDSLSRPQHPSFGVSATPQFQGLKQVNISSESWHKSSLWNCESAATGPLCSFGDVSRKAKLLPMRESLLLEKAAHETRKRLQLEEAAARMARISVSCKPGGRRGNTGSNLYSYIDVNDTGHFLNDQGYYVTDDMPPVIDNKPRYAINESDSDGDDDDSDDDNDDDDSEESESE